MKKIIVTGVFFTSLFLSSCTDKSNKNEEKVFNKPEETFLDYSEIKELDNIADNLGSSNSTLLSRCEVIFKYKEKPYTGKCKKIDQHDVTVRECQFKNGYLISLLVKEKIKNEYFTTDSLVFDNGELIDGYHISLESSEGYIYVRSLCEYLNNVSSLTYEITKQERATPIYLGGGDNWDTHWDTHWEFSKYKLFSNYIDDYEVIFKDVNNLLSFLQKVNRYDKRLKYWKD